MIRRIPDTLVLLGEPIELDTDSGETWTFVKGAFYLASTISGKELWIIPKPKKRRAVKSIPSKAAHLFKRFTGWHPDRAYRFTESEFVGKPFGVCLAVAYRSNKWTGKRAGYIHTFESAVKIQVDNKKTPGIWRIAGAKLIVEARGITG